MACFSTPYNVSLDELQSICHSAQGRGRCAVFQPYIDNLAPAFGINTRLRMAMFLGQVMHESAEFRHVRELGSNAYLAKYDTGRLAARLGNTPEADGDGQLYRGRGLIQITGAANYRDCGKALGLPLLHQPDLLEQPEWAVASACWFWESRKLNELADTGDLRAVTRRINGGLNGLADREEYYQRACRALGITATKGENA